MIEKRVRVINNFTKESKVFDIVSYKTFKRSQYLQQFDLSRYNGIMSKDFLIYDAPDLNIWDKYVVEQIYSDKTYKDFSRTESCIIIGKFSFIWKKKCNWFDKLTDILFSR